MYKKNQPEEIPVGSLFTRYSNDIELSVFYTYWSKTRPTRARR